jgi:hypothetical protein
MIAEREAFVEAWGRDYQALQILTQNQPFRTAVPRFAQHNQITICAEIDFGVEPVTSDTYIAALDGMHGKVSVFRQCIQHLAIPAAALFSVSGFCGLLSWLLALFVSRSFTILRRLRSH